MALTLQDKLRFTAALMEDVQWAQQVRDGADARDVQHARRAYIRAAFAALEGILAAIKRWMLNTKGLKREERACLREKTYVVQNGEAREKSQFIRLADNLVFTTRLMASHFAPEFRLNRTTAGWPALREAVMIRNRITHPKSIADLDVTADDVATVDTGVRWAADELARLQSKINVEED